MPRRGEQGRKPQSKAGAEAIGVAQADNQGALLSVCRATPMATP